MFYDKVNYNEWFMYIGLCFICIFGLYRIKLYIVIYILLNVGKKKKCYVYINYLLNVLQFQRKCVVFLFKNKYLYIIIIFLCLQVMKKIQKCVLCFQVGDQNNIFIIFIFFELIKLCYSVILLKYDFLIFIYCVIFFLEEMMDNLFVKYIKYLDNVYKLFNSWL